MVGLDTESIEREAVVDISVEGDGQEELVPKNGSVSVVWKYFSFKSSNINQAMLVRILQTVKLKMPYGSDIVPLHTVEKEGFRAMAKTQDNC